MALVEVGNSLGVYTARMTVQRSGRVVLHTPIVENGAGMLTVFRTMVAEAFGLPPMQVNIEQTMDGIEYDRGVGGSRITRLIGTIVEQLARRLQERLGAALAAELGADPGMIEVLTGGFRVDGRRIYSLSEAASVLEGDLHEVLRYEPGPSDTIDVYAAQATDVAADRETGHVTIRRAGSAHEAGGVISPMLHQGQIEGGLVQGLGYALTEGLALEAGQVVNANLHEYKLPCIGDVAPLETIVLAPDLGLGITPIGEGPNCGMSASLVNAVVDVVGHQVDIPISPDRIRRALASGSEQRGSSV